MTSSALGMATAEAAVATVARTRTILENIVNVRSLERVKCLQKEGGASCRLKSGREKRAGYLCTGDGLQYVRLDECSSPADADHLVHVPVETELT